MSLLGRIRRLEDRRKPPVVAAPCVVHVERGETQGEAVARYAARYPNLGRNLLIVPARNRTAEDQADFAVRFKAQQLQSVAEARARPNAREAMQ